MWEEETNVTDSTSKYQANHYGNQKPGAAITCMVLGICSVSIWEALYITSIPCIILGIIAVCMASKQQKAGSTKYNGFLKAGKITGWLGIIISALYTIIMTIIMASF